MNLREISAKEALDMLAKNGPFMVYVKRDELCDWKPKTLIGVVLNSNQFFVEADSGWVTYSICAIEVEYEQYPKHIVPIIKCGDIIIHKVTCDEYEVIEIDPYDSFGNYICIRKHGNWVCNSQLFENFVDENNLPIGRIKK